MSTIRKNSFWGSKLNEKSDIFDFDFIPSRENPSIIIGYKGNGTYQYHLTPGAVQTLFEDYMKIIEIESYGHRNKELGGLVNYIKKVTGKNFEKIATLKFSSVNPMEDYAPRHQFYWTNEDEFGSKNENKTERYDTPATTIPKNEDLESEWSKLIFPEFTSASLKFSRKK